ncbi:MAG: hypothetical protein CBC31_009580 [Verrucomicrobia bacterium TMED71]|nr:MAG: hypothetical protein CBC31_009580 [Verrucomicrobia bacterium TMED71]
MPRRGLTRINMLLKPLEMSELPKEELESKIAFLERHIEEQDREILNLRKILDKVLEDVESLQNSRQQTSQQNSDPATERPPHY